MCECEASDSDVGDNVPLNIQPNNAVDVVQSHTYGADSSTLEVPSNLRSTGVSVVNVITPTAHPTLDRLLDCMATGPAYHCIPVPVPTVASLSNHPTHLNSACKPADPISLSFDTQSNTLKYSHVSISDFGRYYDHRRKRLVNSVSGDTVCSLCVPFHLSKPIPAPAK
ncbi:unnamed protein product [Dicrocoelium dendriticum]|nr:unnamed protein product [Dicrocoelium dendriticum]